MYVVSVYWCIKFDKPVVDSATGINSCHQYSSKNYKTPPPQHRRSSQSNSLSSFTRKLRQHLVYCKRCDYQGDKYSLPSQVKYMVLHPKINIYFSWQWYLALKSVCAIFNYNSTYLDYNMYHPIRCYRCIGKVSHIYRARKLGTGRIRCKVHLANPAHTCKQGKSYAYF